MTELAVLLLDVAPAATEEPADGWASTVRTVAPDATVLRVTDLAATRGDGVFETLGVIAGHPQQVEAHLARFAHSAAMLDLDEPHLGQWRAAIAEAAALLPVDRQGGLKLVLSRGVEGLGVGTGWITASVADGDFAERETGLRVVTLERGYDSGIARRAPWLLAGAKTLSYAVNMAAQREAMRRGADDAVFVSSDGYVLEAPTSTVILRFGDRIVTPRTDIGILPGTSQLSVFAFAQARGLATEEALVPVPDLVAADGVWLVSSVRLAAPVVAVDGEPIPHDVEFTRELNEALLARQV
jgi:4-amino-4-deoxychorismate lyase